MIVLAKKKGIKKLVNHSLYNAYDIFEQLLITKETSDLLKELGIYERVETVFTEVSDLWAGLSEQNRKFRDSCIKYNLELEKKNENAGE